MKELLLLALLVSARAQDLPILPPDEAVERALNAHQQLAAAQARTDAARGARQQASFRPNPRLYLQNENTRFGGTTTPFRFSQETDNFAYASQVLEAPGKRESRLELTGELIRRREAEAEVLRASIAQRVAGAYWAAVGAERMRDVLRRSSDNFEQIVQYHRDRVREGAIAEADLIRIELERLQISAQAQNAEQDARRLRSQLFREMGEPERTATVLTGDLSDIRPWVSLSPEEALVKRSDLRLARQVVRYTRAGTLVEQRNARPDPEILFGYKRSSGFNTLIGGVQIPLPIRNRNQGAIAASVAETRAAEFDVLAGEQAARTEIAAAQGEYEQKRRLVTETLPRMRDQAGDTVRIARAVYREGASDLLRLLDAERTALQSELLFVRSLTDYRLALVNLLAATGMLP